MSLYKYAGYSKGLDGKLKLRVANDAGREKVLAKNGHTEVSIVALPVAMSKEDAKAYLAKGNVDIVENYIMDVEAAMTPKQAAKIRAQFNEKVRIAYEAA